jgi:hypothetical protein
MTAKGVDFTVPPGEGGAGKKRITIPSLILNVDASRVFSSPILVLMGEEGPFKTGVAR